MLKVYGFATQNNGCGKYRVWQPLESLAAQGLIEMRREPDNPGLLSVERADDIFKWADVVVGQPFTEPMAACIMVAARDAYNKKLVVDLDDDIWSVHPLNVGTVNGQLQYIKGVFDGEWADHWELVPITKDNIKEAANRIDGTVITNDKGKNFFMRQKSPDARLAAEYYLGAADAVTTTNSLLADKILRRADAKAAHALPNCLKLSEWVSPTYREKSETSPVWVGWCGSVSHYPDLVQTVDVLDNLMARYPQLRVQIMGSSFDYFFPLKASAKRDAVGGYDGNGTELFAGALEDSIERWPGRMSYTSPVNIQQYANWISTNWKSQIALAPLEDNDFNAAKSELKWLEYSALGAATVASKIGPYKRAIEHDVNGKLCGSSRSWLCGLEELIESPDTRQRIADAAIQTLHDKYDQDKQARKWLEVYESL